MINITYFFGEMIKNGGLNHRDKGPVGWEKYKKVALDFFMEKVYIVGIYLEEFHVKSAVVKTS